MAPPVPMTEPLEKRSRPESTESAVASMTPSSVTCLRLHPLRVELHGHHLQLLAPHGDIGDAFDPHDAGPDRPVGHHRHRDHGLVFRVMPIFITRAVADTGGIITGGAAQVGRLGVTIASRS